MTRTPDALVEDYLRQLDTELADLPRSSRREVIDEISAHIGEMRRDLPIENELEIRRLLDRLGDPAEIAADARERFGVSSPTRTWVEVAALVLLSVGVVLPVIGWFAGVILLWISNVWSTRDKLLGTLFAPAGWILVAVLALQTVGSARSCASSFDARGRLIHQSCSGGSSELSRILWPVVLTTIVAVSIAVMIYLAVRLRRLTRRSAFA